MRKPNNRLVFCLFFSFGLLTLSAQYTSDDWKARDRWMNIDNFLKTTGIETAMSVADIGAHQGYLTMHLAEQVGAKGKVYAVDVNAYRLTRLKEHAADRKLSNIEVIVGDYDNPKLPKNSLDIIYVIDAYHEMSEYQTMLSHFFKALKPSGRIVLLEKIKKRKIGASRSEQVDAHTLALHYVKEELISTGFSIEKEIENYGKWERDPAKQMWILIGSKP